VTSSEEQIMLVRGVRRYEIIEKMLGVEDPARIVPGRSNAEVLQLLTTIYPPAKERLGVIVLEIEPVE
jgi:ASC-1-like (ASCH) protein